MHPRIRRVGRRIPLAKGLNRVRLRRDLAILAAMPAHAPNSAGPAEFRSRIALQSAEQSLKLLRALGERGQGGSPSLRVERTQDFASRLGASPSDKDVDRLADLLRRHGSDKSGEHDYHTVYGAIFKNIGGSPSLLEIGLGSNNEEIVSSMGRAGQPGASLRAFRDFLPDARIFGADIDCRILFQESRIRTYFVDQTDDVSSFELFEQLPPLDLIIDDGLHAPNANLRMALLGIDKLKPGGWLVVEDISVAAEDFWHVVSRLFPPGYSCSYVRARGGDLFIIHRDSS